MGHPKGILHCNVSSSTGETWLEKKKMSSSIVWLNELEKSANQITVLYHLNLY